MALTALLRHQVRLLVENRSACIVLAVIVVMAVAMPRIEPPPPEICHIVYWQDHPWIDHLRERLASDDKQPAIEISHVERFTNAADVIEYPERCHSIQIRPPAGPRRHWLVWFWHSGTRADAINPFADWFWSATELREINVDRVHVRLSSLRPEPGITHVFGPEARTWIAQGRWRAPLVWTTVFFCGCYLTAMALAQQRQDGTLAALASTPVGWSGIGRATTLFHLSVTVLLGLFVAIALGFQPDSVLIATILLSAIIYVAVGFTLGCWCRGPASTSASMMVYLVVSVGWLLLARFITGTVRLGVCAELQIVEALDRSPGFGFWGLTLWGMLWLSLARLSFTYLKHHPR